MKWYALHFVIMLASFAAESALRSYLMIDDSWRRGIVGDVVGRAYFCTIGAFLYNYYMPHIRREFGGSAE